MIGSITLQTERTDLAVNSQLTTTSAATIDSAISMWAKSTTREGARLDDLLRDKSRVVQHFFAFSGRRPQDATPGDVRDWLDELRAHGIPTRTPAGELVAMRDYALLLFFVLTGHRREEVLRLTWGNLKKNGVLSVRFLNKGGDYTSEEVNLACWDALVDYLRAAGRLDAMTKDAPLWTAHDRSGKSTGSPLTSHAFAANLKRYARAAGLDADAIHVHRLRHTFARLVGEDEGDLTKVQHALGHKNLQTTRVYLPRVTTKRDTFSAGIARRFGLNDANGQGE